MRIIYLHQYFNLPHQPGGTRSFSLASRLVEMGHEVHMITSDRSDETDETRGTWRETQESGIHVHWTRVGYGNRMSFSRRIIAFLRFAVRATRRARTIDADVIFASSTPLTIAIPAIVASRTKNTPMVFEVRDLWPAVPIAIGALRNPIAKYLARRLETTAYRNSSAVVALAPGMGEAVAAAGFPKDRIRIIPNGADNRIFAAAKPDADSLRAEHPDIGDRPLLLYCGALGHVNGVSYLVDVAGHLSKLDPDIRIAIVGDGAEREELVERARKTGVLGRNLFFYGRVPKAEAARWLLASDMTVALFTGPRVVWKDATQNKFFDSLAAGKPISSNFRGWQCEIAEKHKVGFTVPSDAPAEGAAMIRDKLADTEWLRHAAETGRRLAATTYSMDTHAAKLEKLLSEVVESSDGQR